jgi:hypothetical protein
MTRVYAAAACGLVGVVAATAGVPAVAGAGFVLASLLLAWVVQRGDLSSMPGFDPAKVDLRVYAATTLFIAAIIFVLGVSLWFD